MPEEIIASNDNVRGYLVISAGFLFVYYCAGYAQIKGRQHQIVDLQEKINIELSAILKNPLSQSDVNSLLQTITELETLSNSKKRWYLPYFDNPLTKIALKIYPLADAADKLEKEYTEQSNWLCNMLNTFIDTLLQNLTGQSKSNADLTMSALETVWPIFVKAIALGSNTVYPKWLKIVSGDELPHHLTRWQRVYHAYQICCSLDGSLKSSVQLPANAHTLNSQTQLQYLENLFNFISNNARRKFRVATLVVSLLAIHYMRVKLLIEAGSWGEAKSVLDDMQTILDTPANARAKTVHLNHLQWRIKHHRAIVLYETRDYDESLTASQDLMTNFDGEVSPYIASKKDFVKSKILHAQLLVYLKQENVAKAREVLDAIRALGDSAFCVKPGSKYSASKYAVYLDNAEASLVDMENRRRGGAAETKEENSILPDIIPSHYEYAHMCMLAHGVKDDLSLDTAKNVDKPPENLTRWGHYDNNGLADTEGLFVIVYKNETAKEFVFVFRGTVTPSGTSLFPDAGTSDNVDTIIKNYVADAMFVFGYAHPIFARAFSYTTRKITEIKAEEEHSDFAIKFLGYSLGALIAEFMASETGLTAVVFESPGAKRLIENTRMQSIAAKDFRVLNYKSWPNVINTVCPHTGIVVQLYPTLTLTIAKVVYHNIFKDFLTKLGQLSQTANNPTLIGAVGDYILEKIADYLKKHQSGYKQKITDFIFSFVSDSWRDFLAKGLSYVTSIPPIKSFLNRIGFNVEDHTDKTGKIDLKAIFMSLLSHMEDIAFNYFRINKGDKDALNQLANRLPTSLASMKDLIKKLKIFITIFQFFANLCDELYNTLKDTFTRHQIKYIVDTLRDSGRLRLFERWPSDPILFLMLQQQMTKLGSVLCDPFDLKYNNGSDDALERRFMLESVIHYKPYTSDPRLEIPADAIDDELEKVVTPKAGSVSCLWQQDTTAMTSSTATKIGLFRYTGKAMASHGATDREANALEVMTYLQARY